MSFKFFKKVGLVNYDADYMNTESREFYENEHDYKQDMFMRRMEVAQYAKMLGQGSPAVQKKKAIGYKIQVVPE